MTPVLIRIPFNVEMSDRLISRFLEDLPNAFERHLLDLLFASDFLLAMQWREDETPVALQKDHQREIWFISEKMYDYQSGVFVGYRRIVQKINRGNFVYELRLDYPQSHWRFFFAPDRRDNYLLLTYQQLKDQRRLYEPEHLSANALTDLLAAQTDRDRAEIIQGSRSKKHRHYLGETVLTFEEGIRNAINTLES